MTHRWDELWPAPDAPSDFALRVLVASAEERGRQQVQHATVGVAQLGDSEYQAGSRSPSRIGVWLRAALAACVLLGIGGGVAFKEHQEEAAKRAAVLDAQRKETEERLRRLQADFEAATRREQELMASLADAKGEATRSRLQAELELGKKVTSAAGSVARRGGSGGKAAAKEVTCPPGDPLCR